MVKLVQPFQRLINVFVASRRVLFRRLTGGDDPSRRCSADLYGRCELGGPRRFSTRQPISERCAVRDKPHSTRSPIDTVIFPKTVSQKNNYSLYWHTVLLATLFSSCKSHSHRFTDAFFLNSASRMTSSVAFVTRARTDWFVTHDVSPSRSA